jgi:amino-acid N-acetyltransferase
MKITEAKNYQESVLNLLSAAELPVNDLPVVLDNFIVAIDDDGVTGVAGLELYGNYGLLRSVAVDKNQRGKGIAAELLHQIEVIATNKGLHELYLLTETAAEYFDNKGYEHIARKNIPEEIKESSQFRHVCPESAIAMKKTLIHI